MAYAGRCECGGVAFVVDGPLRGVVACHCRQCRRTSGHFSAYTSALRADVRFERDEGLAWYGSSSTAERGFCRHCGSTLFWRRLADTERMSIAAGSLEGATGLEIERHIFTADRGDYYRIPSDEIQHQAWT